MDDHPETGREAERPNEQLWLRRIGFAARLAVYGALFFALYRSAPENILDRPLATLTTREIVNPLLWLGAWVLFLKALFNPAKDDSVRDLWGKFGIALILGAILLGALFLPNIVASFHALTP